jgi:hypothetical protein
LEALQLPPSALGDAEAARGAYRRLSVRWHPDKNAGQEARAQAVFVRVAAAYNTLTTANFDYKRRVPLSCDIKHAARLRVARSATRRLPERASRPAQPPPDSLARFKPPRWAESYVVPSMQTLEDVLLLAMKGADPFVVDAMLRKRGDYRPHQQFGVDLAVRPCLFNALEGVVSQRFAPFLVSSCAAFSALLCAQVPWSAGSQETPSWDIVGAQHSTTRALPGRDEGPGALAVVRRQEFCGDDAQADPSRVAGASAARPWERVGGTGFGVRALSCRSVVWFSLGVLTY